MGDSGIGDPYWYEWYVGLKYVLIMLYPNSKISHVTLQASDVEGIDDVVIQYNDGSTMCIQVKHTRVEDSLTFSDVFSGNNSWIKKMALGWKKKIENGKRCIPVLYTNRELSGNSSPAYISIQEFWSNIKPLIKKAKRLEDILVDKRNEVSWRKCLGELAVLDSDLEKLNFLKKFTIVSKQPNLDKIKKELISNISKIFGLKKGRYTQQIFDSLCGALGTWSISTRLNEYIDKEEVYKRLSLPISEEILDHQIPSQYPFFESRLNLIQKLSDICLSRIYPIVFLKGEPGCGKSSIISELANRENSVIDFRYHAFRPISPETKELPPDYNYRIKARKLWSDLLDQLRPRFQNRLAEFEVPIRNDFLSPEELREHVLRLLKILYEKEKNVIIIAIDGIDHAARANNYNNIEETFLNFLFHPEEVPEGVCFLIAGQLPEGYPQYPIWLREKRSDVLHIEVPKIESEDIRQLFVKVNHNFSNDQIDSVVRVIDEVANGNTLSAVFAVYEAKVCSSLDNLEEVLTKRKLNEGISAYYEEIWSSAIKRIRNETEHNISYIGTKMAAYISLSSELFDGTVLKNIYKESKVSEQEWTNILRDLQPLLIETEERRFSLIHNDVRVYLMRELQMNPSVIKETASLLADFYLGNSDYLLARHIDLFNLLEVSGRSSELIELFTPKYIIEAWANRRPMHELVGQCRRVIEIAKNCRSWDKLNCLSVSLKTICQFIDTQRYANDINYFDKGEVRIPAILKAERKVLDNSVRQLYHLEEVLDDANKLIKAGQLDRACGLMHRWFYGTPDHILKNVLGYSSEFSRKEKITKDVKSFLIGWGKVIYYTGVDSEITSNLENKINSACLKYIFYGLLDESISKYDGHKFARNFKKYINFLNENKIKNLLVRLATAKKWLEVAYVLKKFSNEKLSVNNQIIFAFLAILSHNNDLVQKFTSPILDYDFEIIDYYKFRDEEIYLFTLLCFIRGWNQCNIQLMTNKAFEFYFSNERDLRTEQNIANLFGVSMYLGTNYDELFYSNKCLTKEGIKVLIPMIMSLYDIEYSELIHIRELRDIRSTLFKISIHCAINSMDEAYDLFINIIKAFMTQNFYVHREMNEIFEILRDNGEQLLIKELFDLWVGRNGLAWKKELLHIWSEKIDLFSINENSKLRVAEHFVNLAKKFDLIKEGEILKNTIGWNWIQFAVITFPLDDSIKWVSTLLEQSPDQWAEAGLTLLGIAKNTSVSNDTINRINRILSMAAAKKGIKSFYQYLHSADILKLEYFANGSNKVIYDGIIACLENGEFSKEDLLSLWCLTIGGLTWRERESRIYIEDLKKAILRVGYKLGYRNLNKELIEIAPLSFKVSQRKGREKAYHWIHKREQRHDTVKIYSDKKIAEYTLDEVFEKFCNEFKNNPNSRFTIGYANEVVERMKKQKTKKFRYYLEKLINFAEQQNEERYISWEEIGILFYQNLFSLLLYDSQDWKLIDIIFSDIENDFNLQYEFNNISKKLENILFFRAQHLGEKELIKGLKYYTDMLKLWTEGDKRLKVIEQVQLIDFDKEEAKLSWKDMCFELLLRNISCRSASQVEVSLQGLWQLIRLDNNLIKKLPCKWLELSDSGKEWMLLFFERLVTVYPHYFTYIETIVTSNFESNKNYLFKVQAWIILLTYKRVSNQSNKDYNLIPEIKGFKAYLYLFLESFIKNNNKEPFNPMYIKSLEEYHSMTYKLAQVQRVLEDQLIEMQLEVDKILRENAEIAITKESDVFIRGGDIHFFQDPQINLLMDTFYKYIETGSYLRKFNSIISQAVTYSEEPFILLEPPTLVYDTNRWFNYYDLIKGLKKIDRKSIISRFKKHINAGINKDDIVLCSLLYFFAFNCDYIFTYELESKEDAITSYSKGEDYNSGIGRTFSLYNKDRYEPNYLPDNKLFIRSSPVYRIPYSSVLMVPTLKLQKSFNLKPSKVNPLIFERKGKKVLWLENYIGPIRDEMDDSFYRQHVLQRWVCSKEFFSLIQKKMKNVTFCENLDIIQLEFNMRDMPNDILMFN
ncbi:ATP-binding protein [Clostridium estertheticum]|uniref:ATP-binding protein n=1 Tax=Clostridium estertheticum TaxID=238834 RepID=UPI001C0E0739|nr:ATP-binding protein [Clostridium estertheticum]MBU3072522.1 ATP-binding protein [Clostridium estertheticum]MBU3162615.1 ATP-binding protein [Clostridium estertheticum]